MVTLNSGWFASLSPSKPKVNHQTIAGKLTEQGIETELETVPALQGVCIGQIISVAKHPDADRLNVCQVEIAEVSKQTESFKTLQIVCGCESVREGLKVAVATPGTKLPGGLCIKATKLRGVRSEGMLCSLGELGYSSAGSKGIVHLHPEAPLNAPWSVYLEQGDVLYHLDITPNRGDLMSMAGVWREFQRAHEPESKPKAPAWTDNKHPVFSANPGEASYASLPAIEVQSSEVGDFYLAKIEGMRQTNALPDWMRFRLLDAKISLHGGVVDILNYVMLETGQPMHAYDAGCTGAHFSCKMGQAGEKLMLLNGTEAVLDAKTLCIHADGKSVGIAGYMGSKATSCTEHTTDIYLECAYFTPQASAYHCRRYSAHSMAGTRYERGVDSGMQQNAFSRALFLIETYLLGKVSAVTLHKASLSDRSDVVMAKSLVSQTLGYRVPDAHCCAIWQASGVEVKDNGDHWILTSPTWRYDLTIWQQYVSEILRFCPIQVLDMPFSRTSHATISPRSVRRKSHIGEVLRTAFSELGCMQTMGYSFTSKESHALFGIDENILLKNPLNEATSVLRSTLYSGLLSQLQYNLQNGAHEGRLFELSNVFSRVPDTPSEVAERQVLASVWTGSLGKESWQNTQGAPLDVFYLKACMTKVLKRLGVLEHVAWRTGTLSYLHPYQQGAFYAGEDKILELGLLHPEIARSYDFAKDVFLCQVEYAALEPMLARPSYKKIVLFPHNRRDLSLMVPLGVDFESIYEVLRSKKCNRNLINQFIFDIYDGDNVQDGCYSMGLALIFQSSEGTLEEKDLSQNVGTIVHALKDQLNIRLRGA